MLSTYINNLENTIQWAQYQDDIDILCLARDHMDQLLAFVGTLPLQDQQQAHIHLVELLPMEWPLWMEACRYEDGNQNSIENITLH